MKISTKTGDKGETSLFGGRRVSKNSLYIAALGDLDELQAFLGACRFGVSDDLAGLVSRLQDDIYRIMSVVGFEMKWPMNISPIDEEDVRFLEDFMSRYEAVVGDLGKFIRPGSTEEAARFNIARTVCRRAERSLVAISGVPEEVLRYLNRLSDLLFVVGFGLEKL